MTRRGLICIAGFGDNASMFDRLPQTRLAESYRLRPLNLPGFGGGPADEKTSLQSLADFVLTAAVREDCRTVMAHSVASIVATLAAEMSDGFVEEIVSLEGNLTAADAYFSGTAADFDTPEAFRESFLARLAEMSPGDPILGRYRKQFEGCDPVAAWQLGRDAHAFSRDHVPGDRLLAAAGVRYLYNPENCPQHTLDWLAASPMRRAVLAGASHWPTIDRPDLVATALLQ